MQKSDSDRPGSRIEEFTSGSVGSAKGASTQRKRGKQAVGRHDKPAGRDETRTGQEQDGLA